MKNTFEEYLQEVHAASYRGTDDDMSDSFDSFVANLESGEVMAAAEEFATIQREKMEKWAKLAAEADEKKRDNR